MFFTIITPEWLTWILQMYVYVSVFSQTLSHYWQGFDLSVIEFRDKHVPVIHQSGLRQPPGTTFITGKNTFNWSIIHGLWVTIPPKEYCTLVFIASFVEHYTIQSSRGQAETAVELKKVHLIAIFLVSSIFCFFPSLRLHALLPHLDSGLFFLGYRRHFSPQQSFHWLAFIRSWRVICLVSLFSQLSSSLYFSNSLPFFIHFYTLLPTDVAMPKSRVMITHIWTQTRVLVCTPQTHMTTLSHIYNHTFLCKDTPLV